jgi:phosphatidylinositol alpha-mannosyltransferase
MWPNGCALSANSPDPAALALGRPVEATGGSGFAEIISHGKNGLLVPPGRLEALAAALIDLLGDDAMQQRLGLAAARRAEDFSADLIAKEIETLHWRAIGAAHSTSPSS